MDRTLPNKKKVGVVWTGELYTDPCSSADSYTILDLDYTQLKIGGFIGDIVGGCPRRTRTMAAMIVAATIQVHLL